MTIGHFPSSDTTAYETGWLERIIRVKTHDGVCNYRERVRSEWTTNERRNTNGWTSVTNATTTTR